MTSPAAPPTTWFVTGTSRGLGLNLVRTLLAEGANVAATTRSEARLLAGLDGVDTARLLALEVEVTDESAVGAAIATLQERFGTPDVVVNNAGYGYLGAVEETTPDDVRRMFDVQIGGTWNVLRAVLPSLRAAGGGHIINISSICGLLAFPGWALYSAAKFALEGLSESLAAEVADHGIRVTIVEPGYFNTDFLTADSLRLPQQTSDAYPAVREMVGTHLAMPGSQLGDPAKAARALIEIARSGTGPLRQQLGSDSAALAASKLESLTADLGAARELAGTTDYVR
jgi:NAD(P)-dependent dehydrogenase (short-subunit alcohol dehydrogenase family)